MTIRLFSLALIAATLPAQPVLDLFDTDRFHAAFFDATSNEVTFNAFQRINWDAKAHGALPWLNFVRPSPAQIARLSVNEAGGPQSRSIDFRAPLDTSVRRPAYLLIHADGIVPLQPVQVKGSVDFNFDASMTAVERRSSSGYIVGRPLHAVTSAAFAIIGRSDDVKDVDPHASFERRKQAGTPVYDFVDGRGMITWTSASGDCSNPRTTSCPDAASVVSFHLHDERLVLIKWKDAICESGYTLFLVGSVLKPIAGNMYGCDP